MKDFSYEYFLMGGLLLTWLVLLCYFIYGMGERQFKSRGKKMKKSWLQHLVRDRKLTPVERLSSRVGYMGVAFLISGQWTVEPILFMIGFCCVLFQVTVRKQWNLVLLQLNGLVAWTMHFINSL